MKRIYDKGGKTFVKEIPSLISSSGELSTFIKQLPKDELKLVFCELINSSEFLSMIKKISVENSRLSELRQRKTDKSLRRKSNDLSVEQDVMPNERSESVQAQ